jgi:hypothetical protein
MSEHTSTIRDTFFSRETVVASVTQCVRSPSHFTEDPPEFIDVRRKHEFDENMNCPHSLSNKIIALVLPSYTHVSTELDRIESLSPHRASCNRHDALNSSLTRSFAKTRSSMLPSAGETIEQPMFSTRSACTGAITE